MTIDGDLPDGNDFFDVINPATGETFARAQSCSPEQLDDAMCSSTRAFGTWSNDASTRRAAMRKAAQVVSDHAAELAALLTTEQGKPIAQARREAQGLSGTLEYFADLDFPSEVLQDNGGTYSEVVRQPIGPVVAITPWNFPLMMAMGKVAPALRAGNSVVLKPSPFTPIATLRLGQILNEALPAGVCNVVSGPDPLGARMCEHPVPRMVSFTGSVATGKRVAETAGRDLKRTTLELGGNDPAILLDDADPAQFVDDLFLRSFFNSGQTCIAIKRLYVPESLYASVVEALTDRARRAVLGDGMDENTDLGPINNLPQLGRIDELVTDAVAQGATVATGGKRVDRPGYFYEPTILSDLADGIRVVDEEQFGPVLPVLSYRNVEDALRRANSSHFGLGGSVWSPDEDRASLVARRLECGTAWVNTHAVLPPNAPFGGVKWSGVGVQGGLFGLLSFTDIQVVHRANRSTSAVPAH